MPEFADGKQSLADLIKVCGEALEGLETCGPIECADFWVTLRPLLVALAAKLQTHSEGVGWWEKISEEASQGHLGYEESARFLRVAAAGSLLRELIISQIESLKWDPEHALSQAGKDHAHVDGT